MSEAFGSEPEARRVPQLSDDVVMKLTLPPETEEWAEELLRGDEEKYAVAETIERTDEGLVLTQRIGGNCNAIVNARMWLDEVEEALDDGSIDPMSFTLVVSSTEAGNPLTPQSVSESGSGVVCRPTEGKQQ